MRPAISPESTQPAVFKGRAPPPFPESLDFGFTLSDLIFHSQSNGIPLHCIGYFSSYGSKVPDKGNLRTEGFVEGVVCPGKKSWQRVARRQMVTWHPQSRSRERAGSWRSAPFLRSVQSKTRFPCLGSCFLVQELTRSQDVCSEIPPNDKKGNEHPRVTCLRTLIPTDAE